LRDDMLSLAGHARDGAYTAMRICASMGAYVRAYGHI
jgi:hypothetical protein